MKIKYILSAVGVVALCTLVLMNTKSNNKNPNVASTKDTLQTPISKTHNANNALDWVGSYEGVLPCADCESIAVMLEIRKNNTFKKSAIYKNKSHTSMVDSGHIFWDSTGYIITLKNEQGEKYKVEENRLRMLDKTGKPITTKLASNYILQKK